MTPHGPFDAAWVALKVFVKVQVPISEVNFEIEITGLFQFVGYAPASANEEKYIISPFVGLTGGVAVECF